MRGEAVQAAEQERQRVGRGESEQGLPVLEAGDGPCLEMERELHELEVLIGRVLQVGLAVSTLLIVAGVVLMFVQGDAGKRLAGASLAAVWAALRHGRGWAVVDAGLFLLILTPIVRVAVSIVAFARSRDWAFTAITTFVLAMLILGLVLGKGGA